MIRAFIAIELPDKVRAALGEVQERMRRARLGVKVSWVKVGNIHLTLQFLGYVPEDKIPGISTALGQVCAAHEAFDVPVGGVGAFPNVNRARVLWVGCGTTQVGAHCVRPIGDTGLQQGARSAPLQELARAVQTAMQEFGFEPEHREFAAHLTLGRIKPAPTKSGFPRPDVTLTKLLDSLRDCPCGTLRVDAVHLFESQLNPQGSIYTKLSSHKLM